jgi:hypothetical protein
MLRALDKRPDPLDLIIWNVSISAHLAHIKRPALYLHVQSDNMIIQHQYLAGARKSVRERHCPFSYSVQQMRLGVSKSDRVFVA